MYEPGKYNARLDKHSQSQTFPQYIKVRSLQSVEFQVGIS